MIWPSCLFQVSNNVSPSVAVKYLHSALPTKELELENGKDRLLPLINVSSVICVNFIYGGSVGGILPRSLQLIGVN